MIPGRLRGGPWVIGANVLLLVLLFAEARLVPIGGAAGTMGGAAGMAPGSGLSLSGIWSSDIVLVATGLLFLGLGFLLPLHAGLLNLAIHGEFLAGFVVGSLLSRNTALVPSAQAGLGLLAGALAGGVAGLVVAWLKRKFAIHEILSGLLLGAAMIPVAHAFGSTPTAPPSLTIPLGSLAERIPWAPSLHLHPNFILAWGILLLVLGIVFAFLISHILRASVRGFDLRAVGANPLAAVAAGVDVDGVQTTVMAIGGACAGLTGALQLWTNPALALARWPFPIGFAGLTVALVGGGYLRGAVVSAALLAVWLGLPGIRTALEDPAWAAVSALLLVLPILWILPRQEPDQGAPRAIWRTRHREPL